MAKGVDEGHFLGRVGQNLQSFLLVRVGQNLQSFLLVKRGLI